MATRIEKPEVGKMYWSKSGSLYRVYAIDGFGSYPIHGAELLDDGWNVITFSANSLPLYDADPTAPEPQAIDLARRWKTRDGGSKLVRTEPAQHGMIRCFFKYVGNDIANNKPEWDGTYHPTGVYPHSSRLDLVPDDDPEPLPALDLTKPVKRRDGKAIGQLRLGAGKDCIIVPWNNSEYWTHLDGQCVKGNEHNGDLIQCVSRPWTAADVPFPWPVFRQVERTIEEDMSSIGSLRQNGLRMCNIGMVEWATLARDWEYTADGKTWSKCEVYE